MKEPNVNEGYHQQIRTRWWSILEHQARLSSKNKENFVDFWFRVKVKSIRIKGGYI